MMANRWRWPPGKALLPLLWTAALAGPVLTHTAIATGRFAVPATIFATLQAASLAAMVVRAARGAARWLGMAAVAVILSILGARIAWPGLQGAALLTASGVPHAMIYASLLVLFGRSLRPGRTDFVTGIAQRVRGGLTPAMLRYTRAVTWAWCGFFAGQLALSAALLAWAPHTAWSLFVNVLDGPSVALMFAAEYAIRLIRFRHHPHASPAEMMRGYMAGRRGLG